MSIKSTCYIPSNEDRQIAESATDLGWDSLMVATMRGIYDDRHPENPLFGDTVNIEEAKQKLIDLQSELKKERFNSLKTRPTTLAQDYLRLKEVFTAEERFDRVNMICTMFSDTLDAMCEVVPNINRTAICNGFTVDGTFYGGQVSIFEDVYNQLMDELQDALRQNDRETAEKYRKVLDNWPAIVNFARIKLRDVEGLKLGATIEYAEDANLDNLDSSNTLADLFDPEESTKEGWQEVTDYISAFGSIGREVRRFLGMIEIPDTFDDLGYPKMLDPVYAHRTLQEIVHRASSEDVMMRKLKRAAQDTPWISAVVDALSLPENGELKTGMFVDLKRAFQPYSITTKQVKNGVVRYVRAILNKVIDTMSKSYMTRIKMGIQLNSQTSVYDSKGRLIGSRWAEWSNKVLSLFNEEVDVAGGKAKRFFTQDTNTQVDTIVELSQAVGIDISGSTAREIVNNPKLIADYTTNLLDMAIYSRIQPSMDGESFRSLIKQKPIRSTNKKGIAEEKISKINTIISSIQENRKVENRVKYIDKKGNTVSLSSYVYPDYLSDFFDTIQGFVEERDTEGLRKYIEEKYFISSYFKQGDKILNKWLEELYNSDLNDENSFARKFTWNRFLGSKEAKFEDFTEKQHAVAMITSFFQNIQDNSENTTANYPIFILGDSGISKELSAPIYKNSECMDLFYGVFKQELQRMKSARALAKKGIKIANFSNNANTFILLPFLNEIPGIDHSNPEEYVEKVSELPEATIKKYIQEYLRNEFENFFNKLDSFGVFDTKTVIRNGVPVSVFENFESLANDRAELKNKLLHMYWNTKFATIQQLQLMTIDPSFYKGTKDLQKRYKEIHATGKSLSLQAIDKYNEEKVAKRTYDRCVYFKDIEKPASQSFLNSMKKLFGEDSPYYKLYEKVSLTDGQGYRTLDSYRQIKIMAKEWTAEMEEAYREIKSITGEPTPAQLQRLSTIAAIFQPLKPFRYTLENVPINDNESLPVPVQHKYAEIVLIPQLLPKGSTLRDMAEWMENQDDEHKIDLIVATSAVKVGCWGEVDVTNLQEGEKISDRLSSAEVHKLNYDDYRIQTNIPAHINAERLFGTQLRKLIMARVKLSDEHYTDYVEGGYVNLGKTKGMVKLSGRNLISFYNSLICANILESFEDFEGQVKDPESISRLLLQSIVSNSRESTDNLTAFSIDDGKLLLPLAEGELAHSSQNLLFSVFKKLVNKQKINGGSLVQASAFGIKSKEESGDLEFVADKDGNILYAECEIPFDLSYKDENGKEHKLNYNDWVNPDGTLKLDLSEELDISKDENKMYQSYYTIDDQGNKHYYKPLIEKSFKGILSPIAYRIPSERDYSILNLQVKRFTHPTAGGVIKVPLEGTRIAGFDFDIKHYWCH